MFGKSLAHIEKIKSVNPINGADNIERVTVLDWNLISKKGDFKEGDLAVYVEIGSILPDGLSPEDKAAYDELDKIRSVHKSRENAIKKAKDNGTEIPVFDDDLEPLDEVERKIAEIQKRSKYPAFEGLRSRNFKVKTLVLNKFDVISQGILFNPAELGIDPSDVKVGADFTEFLGITEVMEDAEEAGVSGNEKSGPLFQFIDRKLMRYSWYRKWKKDHKDRGDWLPFFPPKSDEVNAQVIYSDMYEKNKDKEFVATEKLEGQSIAICSKYVTVFPFIKRKKIFVASRSRNLPIKGCNDMQFWKTVKNLGIDKKLMNVPGEWFIRGEHLGPKIQKNIYKLPSYDIRFYDVFPFNKETKKFDTKLNYEETVKFCNDNGFDYVPVIDEHFKLPSDVQEMLKISNGKTVFGNNLKHAREGLVLRARDDFSISFKAKSPEYSL